jgi:DNA-binding transcriptional MerR regulator
MDEVVGFADVARDFSDRDPPGGDTGARYTIDELTAKTGVPSRTIRFYQASGALEGPTRDGRQAFYDDSHVERLRVVGELQDRGLNLKAIVDLLSRGDAGEVKAAEWLGIGEKLRAPWSDDLPQTCAEAELLELIGERRRPGLIADLVRARLIERSGAGASESYFVPSPALLRIALDVEAAGIDLEDAARGIEILRRRMTRAAGDLVHHFGSRAQKRLSELPARELADSLQALRAVGGEAVRLIFAQEIARALRSVGEEERGRRRERRRERRR